MNTTVGRADPRASAVAVRALQLGLVSFGGNRLRVSVSPFISDVFRPPLARWEGRRKMWNSWREANGVRSDAYNLSVHQRATPEEGGVGIWALKTQSS